MTKEKPIQEEKVVVVTEGSCEFCGYDYSKDRLTTPAYACLVKCPKCSRYSQNFDADYSQIPPDNYDYEKENNKRCPVCEVNIDYHVDGFISYEHAAIWVHRDHTVEETEKALNRPLTELEKAWITF